MAERSASMTGLPITRNRTGCGSFVHDTRSRSWAFLRPLSLHLTSLTLYNTSIVPFTSFNNTLVIGNLLWGLLLAIPIFLGFRKFVIAYRSHLKERIMKWRIMQALQASKIYDLYSRWTS